MAYKKNHVGKGILITTLEKIQNIIFTLLIKFVSGNRIILMVTLVCLLFAILLAWSLINFCTQLQVVQPQKMHYDENPTETINLSKFAKDSPVVSCYYNMPTQIVTNDISQLMPSDIRPHLCTHINIAFGQIKDKKIYLQEDQFKIILDVVRLKKANADLKILLSIGGAGNQNGFSDMVRNHASRKVFIKSVKYILKNYSLDGIDLDWEFPAVGDQGQFQKKERQHFSQLLREIRMEYIREKRNYLLTVAVAAPQIIVDVAYDVNQINTYVDFVNIMTYDFHSYTKFTPFTGLNSPLYVRPKEELYLGTLNINYTVEMYISKGLNRNKIVVGIPTYGHSFALINRENTNIGSPAFGYGSLGSLGFVNYPDICKFISTFSNDTTIVEDNNAKVPYLFRKSEWVSYDNSESVIAKAKYIRNNKLRGAMIYSLNADDYNGLCEKLTGTIKFPLAVSIKHALNEPSAL